MATPSNNLPGRRVDVLSDREDFDLDVPGCPVVGKEIRMCTESPLHWSP